MPLPLDEAAGWDAGLRATPRADVVFLNYPSNPCAAAAPESVFAAAVDYAARTGATVVHDFAYGDLVFDGRRPASFLAAAGARELGVEMFSMSKSYGMAGWRLGFVVGNAEIVERINLLNDHCRAGVFAPLQHAASRRSRGRRTRSTSGATATSGGATASSRSSARAVAEGTFFVWLRSPEGLTADRLLSRSTASPSRPARASARAVPAWCGSRWR